MRKRNPTFIIGLLLLTLLVAATWAAPALASEECLCIDCHGAFNVIHENFDHTAVPGSGTVTIFEDDQHSSPGTGAVPPYFAVTVSCTLCHAVNLPLIHGNDCATCHPTPYNTIKDMWGKGCQQGGCHAFYHTDSTLAHQPFANVVPQSNVCNNCHTNVQGSNYNLLPDFCLNCHAAVDAGDTSPPVTTSDAQAEYEGAAEIKFSITDNGKVGLGRTFYVLDGGPETAAGKSVGVVGVGSHQLEFWSMDQAGNLETSHKFASFNIIIDTEPPVTTSNAQSSYTDGATITLTATDNSSRGVKNTYYQLRTGSIDGPVTIGTTITIPAPNGIQNYTLTFWSEDWSGNVEAAKSVSFTVSSGTGTIKLIWGNSDTTGSPCPGIGDGLAVTWTIGLVGSNTVLYSRQDNCPGWSGVDTQNVTVGPTAYWVVVNWWNADIEDYAQTNFSSVPVTTPGETVLRY